MDEYKVFPSITFTWHGWKKLRFFNNGEPLHWTSPDKFGASKCVGWRDFGPISIHYTNGMERRDYSGFLKTNQDPS